MDDLVDTLTRGNVPQVKTVLASVALALAVYQVVMMAVGYGKVRLPFLKPRAASQAHRTVGDVIVPITLLVAWMCYVYFGVDDGIEHAADDETTRAAIHVWAGSLLVIVLILKVVVVRWWKGVDRFLPQLGIAVFSLFVLTWVTSAGDHLFGG
jgi:Family of unknown function (DUF6529)